MKKKLISLIVKNKNRKQNTYQAKTLKTKI